VGRLSPLPISTGKPNSRGGHYLLVVFSSRRMSVLMSSLEFSLVQSQTNQIERGVQSSQWGWGFFFLIHYCEYYWHWQFGSWVSNDPQPSKHKTKTSNGTFVIFRRSTDSILFSPLVHVHVFTCVRHTFHCVLTILFAYKVKVWVHWTSPVHSFISSGHQPLEKGRKTAFLEKKIMPKKYTNNICIV
jgi:hypothetical protein